MEQVNRAATHTHTHYCVCSMHKQAHTHRDVRKHTHNIFNSFPADRAVTVEAALVEYRSV